MLVFVYTINQSETQIMIYMTTIEIIKNNHLITLCNVAQETTDILMLIVFGYHLSFAVHQIEFFYMTIFFFPL